jgi:predicted Zn-dependent peptidase
MTVAAGTSNADTNIRTRRLDNGITLVFEPMPWLQSMSVTFLLPVGAVTDPVGSDGSAAVLYDWLSRGAADRKSRAFNDELDRLGVRRGGSAGRETTSVSASMLARALPEALPLFADMLRRPRLEAEEFSNARELAEQELSSLEDSPAQRLNELLAARYFASAHGRSSYGTSEGLEALEPDGVRADYRARYGPGGVVIGVAGGADWESLSKAVESHFGDWQGGAPDVPEVRAGPPATHHVEADTSQVHIGLAYPGLPPQHDDWYLQTLALNVLSGGTGSRLFMEVREKRGLAYSVHAFARALRGYGYVVARAGTTPERANETLEVLQQEISRLGEGVASDELERARIGILSQLVMQGESSGARASALANDTYLRGEARSLAQIKSAISGIGIDGVNSFLSRHSSPSPTIVTLGPAGAGRS